MNCFFLVIRYSSLFPDNYSDLHSVINFDCFVGSFHTPSLLIPMRSDAVISSQRIVQNIRVRVLQVVNIEYVRFRDDGR